jgi:hypothetical protein
VDSPSEFKLALVPGGRSRPWIGCRMTAERKCQHEVRSDRASE